MYYLYGIGSIETFLSYVDSALVTNFPLKGGYLKYIKMWIVSW